MILWLARIRSRSWALSFALAALGISRTFGWTLLSVVASQAHPFALMAVSVSCLGERFVAQGAFERHIFLVDSDVIT